MSRAYVKQGQTKDVWLIALGFLALHLLVGAVIPLIADETYYALWASGLDWDYYDHPPMIAGMIFVGVSLLGPSPLGVRLVCLLVMAASTVLTADLARLLGGNAKVQCRAAIYFNISFVVLAVGGVATPDAPSAFFWILSSWAAIQATSRGSTKWWLLAGFAAGLGVMSKFTNLFLGLGYVCWLVVTARGRRSLRTPAPYLAILAALIPMVPLILWNVEHGGLGLERQFGRIAPSGLSLGHVAEYLALLILLPTPIIAILAAKQAVVAARTPSTAILLCSVAPLLVYFLFHAVHSTVPGNWLIPTSAAVAVLAATGAERVSEAWRKLAGGLGILLSFGTLVIVFNPWQPVNLEDNPPNQTRGWPAVLSQIPQDGWIATTDYSLTGQLWLGLQPRPVWSVTQLQRYGFRGPFPNVLCDTPGWLVEKANSNPAAAATLFDNVGSETLLSRSFAEQTLRTYRLRRVSGLKLADLCGER